MSKYQENYDKLFDSFRAEYSNRVPAAALVWWWTSSTPGVRVECPFLGKEFTDNVPLGRDPEGDLFFNDPGDFATRDGGDKTTRCSVFPNNKTDPREIAFTIEWYNEHEDTAFAKFLARDISRKRVVDKQINTTGKWTDAATGTVFARLDRASSNSSEWTLTAGPVHKKVDFTFKPDKNVRVDAKGILMFKDINTLSKGVWLDYRDDRIVFTETQWSSKDFNALFLPTEVDFDVEPLHGFEHAGQCKWSDYNGAN